MQHSKSLTDEALLENPTRQRIVAAARRHFFAHGFRSVTMDDLAADLGMSKKTLYACFPTKAALLEAVLLDKFRTVQADLERITSTGSSDFPTKLHQMLVCFQHHTGEIQPSFVRDLQREMPHMFEVVESRRREVIQRHFSKVLSEGRKAGMIRKDVPVEMIVEILLGATEAIMNPPKLAELGLSVKTGFTTILTVILEGAITEKGRLK
jgi:AcrR family transcriptional regulator